MMMSKHHIAAEISQLLAEAADARGLAAMFEGGPAVADLLGYAATLETEAAQLEEKLRRRFAVDLHDPKQILARCGERAEKVRALAEAIHDVKAREIFLRLAQDYDRLARPRDAAAWSGRKRAG